MNPQTKILSDIKKYGWHVCKVMEEDNNPNFAYSIGLYKTFKHPEIIIIGLELDLAHQLINNIGENIKKGQVYNSNNFYDHIIKNYDCFMATVYKKHFGEYVNQAVEYYKKTDFPLLQCVYPSANRIFPWQNNWPKKLFYLQPLIGKAPKS